MNTLPLIPNVSFPEFKLLEDQQNIIDSIYCNLNKKQYTNTFDILSYGSASHGLFINNYSDYNLCIQWKDASLSYDKVIEHTVHSLSSKQYNKIQILISATRSKYIECFDVHKTKITIVFNDSKKIASSNFIDAYISIDSRLKELCRIVKKWAKQRNLSLPSYCLVLMIIHFLQVRQMIPELSVRIFDIQTNISNWANDNYQINMQFYKDFAKSKLDTLYVLLKAFFRFYGYQFNYETSVVSTQRSMCLTKLEMECISDATTILPLDGALIRGYVMHCMSIPMDILNVILLFYHKHCKYWLCVQDPFNSKINVAANINEESVNCIQNEFQSAFRILSEAKDCTEGYELLNVIS